MNVMKNVNHKLNESSLLKWIINNKKIINFQIKIT